MHQPQSARKLEMLSVLLQLRLKQLSWDLCLKDCVSYSEGIRPGIRCGTVDRHRSLLLK